MTAALKLTVSDPSAIQLFKSDGTKLNDLTLDLSNPSGDLAPLVSGSMNIWFEGLKVDPDLSMKLAYTDSSGHKIADDEIHVDVVAWKFTDGNGNSVQFLQHVDTKALAYLADNADYMPSHSIDDPDDFVTLELSGLASSSGFSFDVSSDASSSNPVHDTGLQSANGNTTSLNKIGLYSDDGSDETLTPVELDTLQQTFGIDVVHNPKASITLSGTWDKQHRDLQAAPKITTTLDKQVFRVGDPGSAHIQIENADKKFTWKVTPVFGNNIAQPVTGTDINVTWSAAAPAVGGIRMVVDVYDGNNKVIGQFGDSAGYFVDEVSANTSAATLQWIQQSMIYLQKNGDVVPYYPVTPQPNASTEGFFELNNRINNAYVTMYEKDPAKYLWCGLAAYASYHAGQGIAASGLLDDVLRGFGVAPNAVAPSQMYAAFVGLNRTIFLDIFPQFVAYDSGGIAAIQAMSAEGVIASQNQIDGWNLIAAGDQARAQALIAQSNGDENGFLTGMQTAHDDYWAGNLSLLKGEQLDIAPTIYNNYLSLFLFLSNENWFKGHLEDPVPGTGVNNMFGAIVPNGVHGGQANVADKDDRWAWVTTPTNGIWATYEAWQPTHSTIAVADVTNTALQIRWPFPTGADLIALENWRPPN